MNMVKKKKWKMKFSNTILKRLTKNGYEESKTKKNVFAQLIKHRSETQIDGIICCYFILLFCFVLFCN